MKADQIRKVVGQYYNIPKAVMMSDCRQRKVAKPRQIAMALTRELTALTLTKIGQLYNRDHTTVLWALKVVPKIVARSERVAADIVAIRAALKTADCHGVDQ